MVGVSRLFQQLDQQKRFSVSRILSICIFFTLLVVMYIVFGLKTEEDIIDYIMNATKHYNISSLYINNTHDHYNSV